MNEQSIKKNSVYNVIRSVASVIFPLISFKYVTSVLMPESVGRVNFSFSFVAYFILLGAFGIEKYAIRECAKVRDDRQELEKLASRMYSLNIITALCSYLILGIILIAARPLDNYRGIIIVYSSITMINTLGADWLNNVMEDFRYLTIRVVCCQMIALILMLIFVKGPEDYLKYTVIVVLASVGGNAINILYRRKFCKLRFRPEFTKDSLKYLAPVVMLFGITMSDTVNLNCGTTILGFMTDDRSVGIYSVASKIYTIVITLLTSISLVVMPKLSRFYGRKEYKDADETLKFSAGYLITLGFPCAAGIFAVARELVPFFSNEDYSDAVPALRLLAVAIVFFLVRCFFSNMVLLPDGREKHSLIGCGIAAGVNIIANIVLIPIFGSNGPAMAMVLSEMAGGIVTVFFGWNTVVKVLGREVRKSEAGLITDNNTKKENTSTSIIRVFVASSLGCVAIAGAVIFARDMVSSKLICLAASVMLGGIAYLIVQVLFQNGFVMGFIYKVGKSNARITADESLGQVSSVKNDISSSRMVRVAAVSYGNTIRHTGRRIRRELLPGAKLWRFINYLLLLTFTVNTIFLPYDTFGLKKISLILLLVLNAREIFFCENRKEILIFGLGVMSVNIAVSILATFNIVGEVMGGYMGYILLLYPVIEKHKVDFEKMFYYTLVALAIVMTVISVADITGIYPLAENKFYQWMVETENISASVGESSRSLSGYILFFKCSPLFAIGIPMALEKKRYIEFAVLIYAMAISGTRANYLVGASVVIVCLIVRNTDVKTAFMAVLVMAVVAVIFVEGTIPGRLEQVFEAKSYNDFKRSELIRVTIDGWKKDPSTIFTGTGFTSEIWAPVRKQWMAITEVSYWNLLRQIGLLPFIATIVMYLYPAIRLFLSRKHFLTVVGFAGYLAIAYTNPLLYSSTGFIALLYMYYLWYREKDEAVWRIRTDEVREEDFRAVA